MYCVHELLTRVMACPIVIGMAANFSSTAPCILIIALTTSVDVSFPSAPNFFNAPTGTPKPSAIVRAKPGEFSKMDFSSSPAKVALLIACLNCNNAAASCCALCEVKAIALLTVSTTAAVSFELPPISLIFSTIDV